jgi:hypothetical protein
MPSSAQPETVLSQLDTINVTWWNKQPEHYIVTELYNGRLLWLGLLTSPTELPGRLS